MQRFVALYGVIILLWTAGMFSVCRSAAMAVTHTVAIDGVTFDPATLAVKMGDTVVWVNKDPFPHTVTAQAREFDSHTIAPGQSWSSTTTRAGMFLYLCTLHSTMHATLKVE